MDSSSGQEATEPDTADMGTEPGPHDDTPRETPETRGKGLFHVEGAELVSPLTLVFVRHGVTDMTVPGLLSGSSTVGPPLNAEGRIQAAKAADAIYRMGRDRWERVPVPTRLIASPMIRAQETAAAIGRRLGLTVESDDRLREINFGEWEGRKGHEIAQEYGDAIHRWRFGELAAPGGESIPEVGDRMDDMVRFLATEHAAVCAAGDDAHRTYVLASHAVAIKSAVALSMGMDVRQWGSIWPQPASVTIMELRVAATGDIAERHLLCLGETTG